MNYKRGAIVLADFSCLHQAPPVPAVILSDSELIEILDLVVVVPLTTNLIEGSEPLRIRIAKREGLAKDHDAMVEQLRSLPKERIIQALAMVEPEEMAKIEEGVRAILHLEHILSNSSQ
ncbi:MAG: type II toxin-antitoxin system PemK/MazF family toxin [Epsilonproteobacteria bacterium]|nr:type II toxin-antitoxin system PemK/MazF family toxin [Campylobacterota bacterium]